MDQSARAQRHLTSFTDSFSYLIIKFIMAALASSSNLLTKQPLEGLRRGGGYAFDVWLNKPEKKRTWQAEGGEDDAPVLLAKAALRLAQIIA